MEASINFLAQSFNYCSESDLDWLNPKEIFKKISKWGTSRELLKFVEGSKGSIAGKEDLLKGLKGELLENAKKGERTE